MKSLKEKVRKASLHFKERASASASPTQMEGGVGEGEDYFLVDSQEEETMSGADDNESYIEPETLQTLTQLIRQFSGVLSFFAIII